MVMSMVVARNEDDDSNGCGEADLHPEAYTIQPQVPSHGLTRQSQTRAFNPKPNIFMPTPGNFQAIPELHPANLIKLSIPNQFL